MPPHSLPGTTYNSYGHSDGRYLGGGWYADGNRYARGGRYADGDRHACGGLYAEGGWYPDNRGWPRQQLRQTPRPMHRRNRHQERPARVYVEYSSSSGDGESGQEVKKPTQKKKAAPLEKITIEDQIKARVEERYEKKIADQKQLEADEKEKEEKRLAAEKEADEAVNTKISQALADQKEAIEKEAAAKELATKNELARLQGEKMRMAAAVKNALAEQAEADKQAEADRMRALREKADADKAETARWKAEVAQEAEKLFAAHIEKQVNDMEAAEKEKLKKEEAEKMDSILMMVKKMTAEYDSMKENKAPSKKPASKKAPGEKNTPKNTATPEKTGIPHWLEDNMPKLKELVGSSSKDDALGHGAALLEEGNNFEGDTEAESLRIEVSSSIRGSKCNVGRRMDARAPKEGKRDGKSNRKAKVKEKQGEYKDGRRIKKGTSESRKPARHAMQWFASC